MTRYYGNVLTEECSLNKNERVSGSEVDLRYYTTGSHHRKTSGLVAYYKKMVRQMLDDE